MVEKKAKPAVKTNSPKAGSSATTTKVTAKKSAVATPGKTKAAVAKKTAAEPVTKQKVAAKTQVATKPKPVSAKPEAAPPKSVAVKKAGKPTPEERYRMVETAAYFIAERHGFQGRSDVHWAAA